MRRCQLCSRSVEGADVVCPSCGGALVDVDPVPTWGGPPSGPDPTRSWDAPATPGPPRLAKAPMPPSVPDPTTGVGFGGGYGAPPGAGPPPGHGPPPGYGGYGYTGYGYPVAPNLPIDAMAVASLVIAIVGFAGNLVVPALPLLACPVAAILGHVALRRIGREQRTSGRGIALAGVIVGWIGTAIGVVGLGLLIWLIWALSSGGGDR